MFYNIYCYISFKKYMSSYKNDIKNENIQKHSEQKQSFSKELLKELLNKNLNQRLLKLEASSKEQISGLNYTSKYFKEFSKAIQQFSKFFDESEELKEKEKEKEKVKNEKKDNINANNKDKDKENSLKIISKKSNESNGSTNLTKNNNKTKQNNKKPENYLRLRSNTQGIFKSQQLKKQATNITLARSLFTNKIIEEKNQNKQKQNMILSPENEKINKSINTFREGLKNETPLRNKKSTFCLERNTVNMKVPKTEKRVKKKPKKKLNDNNKNKYNNISELKTENEKYNTEKENLNLMKFSSSFKKNINKNPKNEHKNKKEIKFNLHNTIKESVFIDDFNKTVNNKYINKTIDLDDNDKNNFLKSSFSTKKKRKFKINNESENINDIKDIVKLVDNVHQNITKLLENNERFNNNKSLMMSSLELANPNKTYAESYNRSSAYILDNFDDEINSQNNKGFSLKKKKNCPNFELLKENPNGNEETNNKNQIEYCVIDGNNKSNNDSSNKNEKVLSNKRSIKSLKNLDLNNRYQEQIDFIIQDINKEKDNIEIKNYFLKKTNVIDIFKKDKKYLRDILKYLNDIDVIKFTSSNNYLNKERISFLDNKKEELLKILNLEKDETMEIKIKKIKKEFSEEQLSNPPNEFNISEEIKDILKQLNNNENKDLFKRYLDENDPNKDLLIKLYKIFFILIDKEEIYNLFVDNHFWKKCGEYLIENSEGNIGDFIIEKISEFIFNSKSFNKIEHLIKDNKENFINELKNDKKYFISPLIKEALIYCGVIFEPKKTQGNIIIKNLKKNQMVINYLNNLKVRYFLAKYEEDDDDSIV